MMHIVAAGHVSTNGQRVLSGVRHLQACNLERHAGVIGRLLKALDHHLAAAFKDVAALTYNLIPLGGRRERWKHPQIVVFQRVLSRTFKDGRLQTLPRLELKADILGRGLTRDALFARGAA